MRWIIYFLGNLPLQWLQSIGSLLGFLTFHFSKNDRRYILENTTHATQKYGIKINPIACAKSAGMMLTDSLWIWHNPQKALAITEIQDWHLVEEAYAEGRGLLMLTPHLGAFEMIPRVLAEHFTATIIYKPAKQAWLNELIEKGRSHPQMNFVPANLQGVRQVARALQKGEAVGILPDQVPGQGEGVWASFFGKPAYTAVLPAKIANKNAVPTIIFSAIRKPNGKGWLMQAKRITTPLSKVPVESAEQINQALEEVIMTHPDQYLWSYNRYKAPLGISAPVDGTMTPKAIE
ncbi:lysophospholipid acyltransferase family protein [Polynucleobacter kasalickyi]|uniref:KDO2-lipid IV(A) lauroyltransferase n=1 Tax=Polynucleobacter kasalickyi TaxID=1938817 RepID=A0A1W2AVH4_9BURK|nr:lysophospholipid acyltransferase family protein [Polynucleobacter kasalickyi]SMC64696.1 KDO2-lipid IV(A) lauroyltransferase [Polynucleobacter kasalickyi]